MTLFTPLQVRDLGGDLPYPVELFVVGEVTALTVCLSVTEAEQMIADLLPVIEQIKERNTRFVQVRFGPGERALLYTYEDPEGDLEIGDEVFVPAYKDGGFAKVKVVALGRGTWDGPVKTVAGRAL